jgi:hypothetical protein
MNTVRLLYIDVNCKTETDTHDIKSSHDNYSFFCLACIQAERYQVQRGNVSIYLV